MSFKEDIENLIAHVPTETWKDKSLCGVLYDFFPWHGYSSISLQTRQCNPSEPASWKYFEISKSNGSMLSAEFLKYKEHPEPLIYHSLLCKAAEALLEVDFRLYHVPRTIQGFHLYAPFRLQVLNPDKTFTFNYCEFILAFRATVALRT